MQLKEFILTFGDKTKELIKYYEEFNQLKGNQKKDRVVDTLSNWIEITLKDVKMNGIFKMTIKLFIKFALPEIVQVAFNLIESNIKGITK